MTRVSSDVDVVRMFSSNGLSLLLRALLMILGSLVMMFLLDVRLSLIMVALLPLAGLLIWTVMRLAQPMFVIVQRKLSALNTIVQENLAGARVVKAYARERFEIARFSGYNDDYMDETHQGRPADGDCHAHSDDPDQHRHRGRHLLGRQRCHQAGGCRLASWSPSTATS